jgi:hypothetical protein
VRDGARVVLGASIELERIGAGEACWASDGCSI